MPEWSIELLTERYQGQIAGVLSCYDRVLMQGTLPKWCYAKGKTDYFHEHQIRIFDYPKWAEPLRDAIRDNMERTTAFARRPLMALSQICSPAGHE